MSSHSLRRERTLPEDNTSVAQDDPAEKEVNASRPNLNHEHSDNNSERTHAATEPGEDKKEKQQDDSDKEGDEEQQSGKPAPCGFFDPRLNAVRKEAITKWIITTSFLMAFILACLSIFWGAFLHVETNLSALNIYVVDFDGKVAPYDNSGVQPIVGPTIVAAAQKQLTNHQSAHLGWEFPAAADFQNDPIQVRQAVYDWDAWAAIVINPNATALLQSAIETGNSSYDPTGALQLIFQDSRDDTNWYDFIMPLLTPFMDEASAQVGEAWAKHVVQMMQQNASLIDTIAKAPQALSPAVGFSQYNLRPFYPYTCIPAVSIGLIYLIILSFFSFSFYLPIHFKFLKPEGHPPLHFWQLCFWRWLATLAAYFMLSLAYSFVSLAMQINFAGGNPVTSETGVTISAFNNPDAYGHGTFPVYWMLNFFGMIALGFACENVAMFVGAPWTGLWLIFWVITNVCSAFYDPALEPGFYHWGYAWPLHSVVEGSRQILFGLHSRIGLDFGILIAWGVINTAIFPCACYFMRWKSKHHVHEYYR